MMTSLFANPDYIYKHINPGELMWGLYWIASVMQNVEIGVSFYDILREMNYSICGRFAIIIICM